MHTPSEKKHCFVYLVRCSDGTLSTGITGYIKQCIREINGGHGPVYTRSRLPVFMTYTEEYMNENDAKKRQATIQKMTREQKERLISLEHVQVMNEE